MGYQFRGSSFSFKIHSWFVLSLHFLNPQQVICKQTFHFLKKSSEIYYQVPLNIWLLPCRSLYARERERHVHNIYNPGVLIPQQGLSGILRGLSAKVRAVAQVMYSIVQGVPYVVGLKCNFLSVCIQYCVMKDVVCVSA